MFNHVLLFFVRDAKVKLIQEIFKSFVFIEVFDIFSNIWLQDLNILSNLFEFINFLIFGSSCVIEHFWCVLRLLFNSIKEINEEMRIRLEHVLRTRKTVLSHGRHFRQPLDLGLLDLKHLLNEAYFALFLNQLPSVFSVLRPLNRNREAGRLSNIHFALDFWIDRQLRWLNIRLTNFPEASFTRGTIFLPDS